MFCFLRKFRETPRLLQRSSTASRHVCSQCAHTHSRRLHQTLRKCDWLDSWWGWIVLGCVSQRNGSKKMVNLRLDHWGKKTCSSHVEGQRWQASACSPHNIQQVMIIFIVGNDRHVDWRLIKSSSRYPPRTTPLPEWLLGSSRCVQKPAAHVSVGLGDFKVAPSQTLRAWLLQSAGGGRPERGQDGY